MQVEKNLNVHSINQTKEQEKELHLAWVSPLMKRYKAGHPWSHAYLESRMPTQAGGVTTT